jgi:hypothetical protein
MTAQASAQMWDVYQYQGHRVTVIQQWQDPFGRSMVRVQIVGADEDLAAGMPEADFMREAVPVPAAGPKPKSP